MKILATLAFALATATLHAQTAAPAAPPADLHADLGTLPKAQQANIGLRTLKPGDSTGPHIHHGVEQTCVISGAVEMKVVGRPTRVYQAGECMQVPRDVPHQGTNIGTVPVVMGASWVTDSDAPVKIPVPSLDAPAVASGK
jgi:quercetin dioxygenase-like cupin family protein